jgi:oligoendopeptidase F
MKVTIEVDCTPEEARRVMGLPDLTPLHDRYIQMMQDSMNGTALRPEMLENMMKSWTPMGEAGAAFWRRLFEAGTKPGG